MSKTIHKPEISDFVEYERGLKEITKTRPIAPRCSCSFGNLLLDMVHEEMKDIGGTILKTSLPHEDEEKLQAALSASRE